MKKTDFEIIKKIYASEHTTIFEVVKKSDGETYIIKSINADKIDVKYITNEAKILKIVVHDNIIKYYGSYVDVFNICLILEKAHGSIHNLIKLNNLRYLNEMHVSVIIRETLRGLQTLHNRLVIHRDIKSNNILLGMDFKIKLTDFGYSALQTFGDPMRSTITGTYYWMAPEIFEKLKPGDDEGYTNKIDIWSVGITCLELLFGNAPYDGVVPLKFITTLISDEPPDPKKIAKAHEKKISIWCSQFIKGCLQKNPEKRKSVDQLLKHPFIKKYNKISSDCLKELFIKK